LQLLPVQGPWAPRKIPNPKYFSDETPLKNVGSIGGVAVEIWTMDNNYFFDNILVTNQVDVAEEFLEKYWRPKQAIEVSTLPLGYMTPRGSPPEV
jgi:calnexin